MNDKDTTIISLLKGINSVLKSAGSSGNGSMDPSTIIKLNALFNDIKDVKSDVSNNISKINDLNQKIVLLENSITIDPDEDIPLEIPPTDTLYYRTYVDDAVYIGPSGSLSGYAGVDSLGNLYFDHRGVFTIENLKESLESPSAQVGVLNELITEISVPDNVNILGRAPSKNLKTIIANNVWEMSQDFKGTLWYTQKEQGPVKLGSLLFGYRGTVPAEIPLEVTQDVKNINSSAFIGTDLETITLSDSIEKVGTKAFCETPFIKAFEDGPIYFGKTLYDVIGTYKVDTFDIPEGIVYINKLGHNVIDVASSGSSGVSGDSGVGDIETGTRNYFDVNINRINIPSTAILNDNPFNDVQGLQSYGFPNTLPTMSDGWLLSSGSSGISVKIAYYNGTKAELEAQLLITGTKWLLNSLIVVIYCLDGEYWLQDVKIATYTTVDGSLLDGSLSYGKLLVGDDFHLADDGKRFDAGPLEIITFDECTILGRPVYYGSVFNYCPNIKSIDMSKVYLNNYDGTDSSYIPRVKECSSLETYLSPYEIGPNYYDYEYYDGGEYKLCPLIGVPEDCFFNCFSLHTVTLPNNLTVIKTNSFYKCNSLNNIILPNTLRCIDSCAFSQCYSLDNVLFEGTKDEWYYNVNLISDSFSYTPLEVIHCSDGDVRILNIIKYTATDGSLCGNASYVYDYNYNGQGVLAYIKEFGTSIPNNLFLGLNNLLSVEIPNYITSIGYNAFENCYSLTSVTIPNSVTSIELSAFYNCTGLTEIISLNPIPPRIYDATFFNIDKSIPLYVTDVEAYLNAEYWKEFYNIQTINSDYDLTVSSSDETMGTALVDHHTKFSSLVTAIPNEGYIFTQWSDGSTENPRVLTVTEDTSLQAMFEIKMFTVNATPTEGGTVTGVGVYPYGSEVTLEAIPYNNNKFLGWSDGDKSLTKTLLVYDDITLYAVFGTTYNILYTTNSGSEAVLSNDDIVLTNNYDDNLGVLECFGDTLPDYMFANTDIKSISIPNKVTDLGKGTFRNCHYLLTVDLPDSITEFKTFDMEHGEDYGLFYRCNSLTSIEIPANIVKIDSGTFAGCCFTLDNFINHSSCQSDDNWGATIIDYEYKGALIKDNELIGCRAGFDVLELPENIHIPYNKLSYTFENIKTVILPETAMTLGTYAFSGFRRLKTINIPDNCIVEPNAFKGSTLSSDENNLEDGGKTLYVDNCLITSSSSYNSDLNHSINGFLIREGTRRICSLAFTNHNSNIMGYGIPLSMKKIDNKALFFSDSYYLYGIIVYPGTMELWYSITKDPLFAYTKSSVSEGGLLSTSYHITIFCADGNLEIIL